ncbi:MAG TPA: FAD-dependent oxidoreductase, partial [Kiritimatiellae bacterium]|nr:FAD-dependent oxidoreductase [Kiritimatiellia bacterium]
MRKIETDVLIIGGGLAGLSAALHLDSGLDVMVVCKKTFRESNSARAQGGIACPLAPGDSVESHVRDTLAAGAGLSREKVVREVIVGSFAAIEELEKLGVRFTRDDGQHFYDLGREGGHSHRRILHAGDVTGAELLRVLLKEVASRRNCRLVPGLMAVDLITTGWLGLRGANRCVGAYFLEPKTGDILAVRCDALVLATGGAGKVYLYTSNEDTATGDGIAMAWRCGLPIMNLEFVQFHPTCLFHPEAKSFLISEAVRGEGAVLVTAAGERFMPKYHPRGELAPRDVVARAIDRELKVSGQPCVYLDITHKPESFLRARFPNIYATCLKYGYDMARDRIPVVPAAHYFCGGVEAEADGR